MLVKQKLALCKKCKNMSTKQEIICDATFKSWLFSSDFDFACKDGRVNTASCKYYCPLAVNPTNVVKSSILNVVESLSLFENIFFLIILKIIVFFCYFLQFDEVFLISFLDCCYHYLVFLWIQSMVV